VKESWKRLAPILFFLIFAFSRVPGIIPSAWVNFSVVYAFVFCAGVYFKRSTAWWLPLAALLATDIALNFYYQNLGWDVWQWPVLKYQLFNYAAYLVMIGLGRRFKPQSSFLGLLGGGILGALLFYFITNTASWLFNPFHNPEYRKTFVGWLIALIKGTGGWPQTWEFFRNTLLSGGLFTAFFVGAMKLTAPVESPVEKIAGVRESEPESEETPEEAKA
jgi:hypothetical protein